MWKVLKERGTLSHQFLLCHKLQNYWCQIFDFLAKAFKRDFPPEPLIALFGVVEAPNHYEVQAVSLCTLLARKLILQAWKSDKPPTVELWLKELGNVLHLERIRFTLSKKERLFQRIWSPIIEMLAEPE